MKVLQGGQWKDATPKGVKQGSVWKTPQRICVLQGGQWVQTWPNEPEPPYLYGVDIEYLPNYEVKFTAKKGRPYDPNEDEYFMFRCVQMPRDGYVYRDFTKQWAVNGYGKLDCTLEDCFGDGIPANNAEMRKTISFQITPRA